MVYYILIYMCYLNKGMMFHIYTLIYFLQPKRFDYPLKSPGIKPNAMRTSTRGHFFPLLPSGGTGYRILNDTEEVEPQSPLQTSPPCSPTDVFEPASPTKPGNSGNTNVYTCVLIKFSSSVI